MDEVRAQELRERIADDRGLRLLILDKEVLVTVKKRTGEAEYHLSQLETTPLR